MLKVVAMAGLVEEQVATEQLELATEMLSTL
jgi:hypothetical protein